MAKEGRLGNYENQNNIILKEDFGFGESLLWRVFLFLAETANYKLFATGLNQRRRRPDGRLQKQYRLNPPTSR